MPVIRFTCSEEQSEIAELFVLQTTRDNGPIHRLDGPAIIYHDTRPDRYYVNGIEYFDKLDWAVAVAEYRKEHPDGD